VIDQSLATFDEAIAAAPLGNGLFEVTVPGNWTASGRAAGGLVEAQLFAGMAEMMGESDKRPLSFTAHLLRAPEEGAANVQVEVLREGRSIANLAVNMTQNTKLIATALASFATARPGPELDEQPMPDVDPPNPDRTSDSYIPEFAYPYGHNVVIQDRLGPTPFSAPDGPMERVGWVGFAKPRPVDAAGLLMIGDIGMMGWWVRLDKMHITATLDHTTHFRADVGTVNAHDLVLMRSRTRLVRGGYLDWDADIWAPDGTLLCQSRQLLAVLE
jgi:acyl-CoA thioesterase